MNSIDKLILNEYKKVKKENYIKSIILEEHANITEDAAEIRQTLDTLDYTEKSNQLDSGGPITNYASVLFRKFFEFLKKENPDVVIRVTAGHDKFHKKYNSRHNFGEALDFTVDQGSVTDVAKTLKTFKNKHSSEFKFLDEYKNPTPHSTGPHFHIAYIGSQSQYNKSQKSGAAGKQQQAGMNVWYGESDNGVNLEKLDRLLGIISARGKGTSSGKMLKAPYKAPGQQEELPNHKWEILAVTRAPKAEESNPKMKKNEDGILIGANPERLVFYPNGNVVLGNQPGLSGKNYIKIENIPNWIASAGMSPIGNGVITLYNIAGDELGTLYNDTKYGIVFDLSNSPQYAVNDKGEVTGVAAGMNIFQTVLDVLGFIPFYGDIIDLVNAVIYYYRGKYLEAALSLIAVIPIVGSVIKFGAKGSMKVGKASAKLFLNKISFKLMFKSSSKQGVQEAADFILALKKSGAIDSKDLVWLSKSGALDVIYKGLTKTDKALKKYLPKTAYKSVDAAIDALQTLTKNLEGGINAVKNSPAISKSVKAFGPDAIKVYKQTKIGSYSGRLSGVTKTILKYIPLKKTITRITQLFSRMPASRLKYIDEIINKQLIKELKTNKTKLGFLIRTMDPVQVFKILDPNGFKQLGKKFAAGKGNINPAAFKNIVNSKYLDDLLAKTGEDQINAIIKVAKESDNIFFKTMAGSPRMWFKSQMDVGAKTLLEGGQLWRAFRTSLGAKSFDLYYNEISELMQKELGFDFGQYGDEQQSVILYPIYYAYEKAIGKTDFLGVRYNKEVTGNIADTITTIAKFLSMGTFDPSTYLRTHDQVWWPAWNAVPGKDDTEKLLWVKDNLTDDEAIKSIEKILKKDGSITDD